MKKSFTILMIICTLCSILAIGVSAEQTNMEVTVPKFAAQPTIDGCISVEEWGEKTVRVVTDGAATEDDIEIGYNEELGLKNHFYYFTVEGVCDSLAYDMWLRWDETNMYIAVTVEDPDPFSLAGGGDNLYKGDSIQFIIDTVGPSAVMFFDDEEFDYKTDSFNGGRYSKPWSTPAKMDTYVAGLVRGKTPSFLSSGEDILELGAQVGITYVNNDDLTCTAQYECLIPWAVIDELAVPKAGDAYGMSLVVSCSDASSINAWLQWGQGVASVSDKMSQPRETRGGSQAIVLSDEVVTPAAEYAIADESSDDTETELVLTLPDVSHYDKEAELTATDDGGTNAEGEVTSRVPVTGNHRRDDDGLSTGAMIGITCAIVVVAVAVIIVIKKKNS